MRVRWILVLVLVLGLGGAVPATADQSESGSRTLQAGLLTGGVFHNCAVLTSGSVRCWGLGSNGRLGYGNVNIIGNDEAPSAAGDVPLGAPAVAVTAGTSHTCALLRSSAVRCWGTGDDGALGYGTTTTIGDDEPASAGGDVPLGAPASAVAAGAFHTCALLSTGAVRCWGFGGSGQLGYGNTTTIGDTEPASAAGDVPLGATATAITAGADHTCALLSTGAVRCWGGAGVGQLGYGNTTTIGDNEAPSAAGDVPLGATATAISAGTFHTCALLSTGAIRCWGWGDSGRLGYGNATTIGDTEPASAPGDVPLGATATAVTADGSHTCALLSNGAVRCWGSSGSGQLGYGNVNTIGDNEAASTAGDVPLGAAATAVTAGGSHTCALLTTGAIRCWGSGSSGKLGYGNNNNIGDNEPASAPGDVPLGGLLHGQVADLSLALTAPATAAVGVPYSTTVTVTNTGPDPATGVSVLAPGLDGATAQGLYVPNSGTWTVGTLAAGATATLSLTQRADTAGARSQTAELSTSSIFDPDSTPGNGLALEDDRVTATTAVSGPPATQPPPAAPPVVERVRGTVRVTAVPRPRARLVRIAGTLTLPVGTATTACSGRLTVRLKRGPVTLATGRPGLSAPKTGRACRFATTLRPKRAFSPRQKLTVTVSVPQTARLTAQTATFKRTVPRR